MLSKVCIVKAMVFPIVMYGFESWTKKKAEHQWTDVFKLWCWRRLLRVPWTARRSNQSVLKGINPEYSLEGLIVKLKLQSFGYLMWRTNSLEKTVTLGKTEGRRRGWQRMRWLDGITDSMDMIWTNFEREWRTGQPGVLQSMGLQSQTRLSNWIITLKTLFKTSNLGTSLAVQGLRFHASTAGAWVSSLVGEIRTHKPQEENKPKTSNLWQIFHSTLYFFWT